MKIETIESHRSRGCLSVNRIALRRIPWREILYLRLFVSMAVVQGGEVNRSRGLSRVFNASSMLASPPLLSLSPLPPGIAPISTYILSSSKFDGSKVGLKKEANPRGTCIRAFGQAGGYRERYYGMWIIGGWVGYCLYFYSGQETFPLCFLLF